MIFRHKHFKPPSQCNRAHVHDQCAASMHTWMARALRACTLGGPVLCAQCTHGLPVPCEHAHVDWRCSGSMHTSSAGVRDHKALLHAYSMPTWSSIIHFARNSSRLIPYRGAVTLTRERATQNEFAASAAPGSSNCIRSRQSVVTVFLAHCAPPGMPAAHEVCIRIPRARDGAAMYPELEYDSADDAERALPRPPAQLA